MLDFDVCAVEKTYQLAHRKTADHKAKYLFQLVFTGLMEQIKLEALRGHKYIRKISHYQTKWTEAYLLKKKKVTLSALSVHQQSMP